MILYLSTPLNLKWFDSYVRRKQVIFSPFESSACGTQRLTGLEGAGEVVFIQAAFDEASQRRAAPLATRAHLKHSTRSTVHVHFSPTSYTSHTSPHSDPKPSVYTLMMLITPAWRTMIHWHSNAGRTLHLEKETYLFTVPYVIYLLSRAMLRGIRVDSNIN